MKELDETDPDPDDVEVLRDDDDYMRREVWTDGEWIRLGRDVLGDRYFEMRYEDFRDFTDKLRHRSETGVLKHRFEESTGISGELIVEAGHSLDIYRDRKHILYYNDHEYGILYTAISKAQDKRETFDYTELVEGYVESLFPTFSFEITDLRGLNRDGLVDVTVQSDRSEVRFDLINDLKEDPHVMFKRRGKVYANDDGQIIYEFRVKGSELNGAPDEEE